MENKAYVVVGETGMDDEWHMWLVRVFLDEESAEDFADACNDALPEVDRKDGFVFVDHPLDPNCCMVRYSNTEYRVVKTDMGAP